MKQPEALKLADEMDEMILGGWATHCEKKAAPELRRLHEAHDWQYKMAGERLRRIEKLEQVNQELLEALKDLYGTCPTSLECQHFHHSKQEQHRYDQECKPAQDYLAALRKARAAIAKGEKE